MKQDPFRETDVTKWWRDFSLLMEPGGSQPCSQQPLTILYSEAAEFHIHITAYLQNPFQYYPPLRLGLPSS
jgi:hypothetical protein